MVHRIILPKLGLTMDEGTIARWVLSEGDRVEKGQVLLDVETDKATIEVESPASGYVRRILAPEGMTVPVADLIGYITDAPDDPLPDGTDPAVAASPVQQTVPTGTPQTRTSPAAEAPPTEGGMIKAAPAARRLAHELGVELSSVTGTGPGGRITTEDVERARSSAAHPQPAGGQAADAGAVIPLSRMRKAIGERMTLSRREVPQFTLSTEVDMTEAVALREKALRGSSGVRVTYTDILILAVAAALSEHPEVNASYVDEGPAIRRHSEINVGIAVALEEGLMVPVMRGADRKSLEEIAASRKALTEAAQAGKLGAEESSGATFTISNLGSYRVDRFDAIVNPPEAAILAVGRITDRVAARDGWFAVRPVMTLTLTCDHRVLDGAVGARFLGTLAAGLEAAAG